MKTEMDTHTPLTLEERLKKIENAIARKKLLADGQCVPPFTTAENMEIYEYPEWLKSDFFFFFVFLLLE